MREQGYDFRTKQTTFWWEEKDTNSLWGYKELEIDNIFASTWLEIPRYNRGKELRIFKDILKGVCQLGNSEYISYYNSLYSFATLVPDEDLALIKTTIQLYEENYNDRVTNLKAAFEQRKLEYLQSSSVSTKVSRLSKGKQSVSV